MCTCCCSSQWKINIIQKNCVCHHHHHHHHYHHHHHHYTWRDQRDNGKESQRPTQGWKEQNAKWLIKVVWCGRYLKPIQSPSKPPEFAMYAVFVIFSSFMNRLAYGSCWEWIFSHIRLWNPIDIEYILIDDFEILLRVILFSYITLKCCWEWIYPHIWLWNPVESDYIIIYDFEMLLRVNIFSYMTLKSCWEWLYSHIWLWNDVESEYIFIYYFEMLGAISLGANQFSVVHQCIQAGQVSFWHRFQPQFNSEKVVTHRNLSHFTLEKKVIQSNSFCEIDLRRIWARRRLIVFVGVRSDW